MVKKISMSVDDTLELDYLVEQINDNTIDVTEPNGASFSLDYGRKKFGIFDPSDPGTYTLDIDGQTIEIQVTDILSSGILRYEFEQDLTDSWNNNDAVADNTSAGFVTTAQEGSYSKEFDGTDDYITVDTWANLGFSNGDAYSVVFWMYPQDVSNRQRVLGTQTGGPGILLFHNRSSNGDLSWYHNDGKKVVSRRQRRLRKTVGRMLQGRLTVQHWSCILMRPVKVRLIGRTLMRVRTSTSGRTHHCKSILTATPTTSTFTIKH